MTDDSAMDDFEWLCTADVSEYRGQYIAVWHKTIAGHGQNAREALNMAREKYPGCEPLLTWVPDTEAMVF